MISFNSVYKDYKVAKMVVVYSKKTRRLIPFLFGTMGEVIISNAGSYDIDDLFVNMVDVSKIDFERGVLVDG